MRLARSLTVASPEMRQAVGWIRRPRSPPSREQSTWLAERFGSQKTESRQIVPKDEIASPYNPLNCQTIGPIRLPARGKIGVLWVEVLERKDVSVCESRQGGALAQISWLETVH